MHRGLVLITAVAAAVAAMAFFPGAGIADEATGPDCGLTAIVGSDTACLDEQLEAQAAEAAAPAGLPTATCRLPVEYLAWTASDWDRLGRALVANAAPCGEYWVSIPPLAANKTGLRVLQDDVIRALGPNIHPVAEMTLGAATGWAKWVANGNGTWFQAGVEFRRRMAAAGYRPDLGETWLLNEFDRSTMRDADRTDPDQREKANGPLLPPYRRADMESLLQGLYYGAPGMPVLPGAVEYGIHFRHQNIPDVPAYKTELQAFLEDGGFWSTIDPFIRWFAVETYPDVRYWGVPGSSRNDRARHLAEYIFHVLDLARNGPSSVDPARALLERAYLPLLNSGWRARGGDQFAFVTGHGNTIVDAPTMQSFVSEQVYAVRHYAGAHTQGAPQGRIGFSFEPVNRQTAQQDVGDKWTPEFTAWVDELVARIAAAVADSYGQGGSSPVGACLPPGTDLDWCNRTVADAAFTENWHDFGAWSRTK